MISDDFDRFPERPPSEVEWEELLVKYEIAPRALGVAVADVEDGSLADALTHIVVQHVRDEFHASLLLEAMRDGLSHARDAARIREDDTLRGMADAFAGLRGRNFAAVQRRGIDVWEWSIDRGATRVTPYRLLLSSVARDGEVLAMVRGLAAGARA